MPQQHRRFSFVEGAARFLPCLLLVLALPAAPLPAQISQTAYVKASNTGEGDMFGTAVAISGDTMVIGARYEDSAASGVNGNQASNALAASGAAYVFVRAANGVWTQQAYLKALDPKMAGQFGYSVAISGNLIAVGSPGLASNGQLGAVYIFTRTTTAWQQTARLVSSNLEAGDDFGHAVALSGNTLLVGAPKEDSGTAGVNGNASHNGAFDAGAAYVFVRGGNGTWAQQAYLKPSNTYAGDQFGLSVALDGGTAVVGSINERSLAPGVNGDQNDRSGDKVGAAYVFSRTSGVWTQTAYLKAAQPANSDRLGYSVAISGPVIACGSARHQLSLLVAGANGWEPDPSFPAALPGVGTTGRVVALSGDKLLIGLFNDGSAGAGVRATPASGINICSGGTYLYQRTADGWERQAFLKASNAGRDDFFGCAVAVSGHTAVIGAMREDSYATGINSNELDNTVLDSGAAYVFNVKGPFAEITSAARSGNSFIIEFNGPPGLTEWKVMGASDLIDFNIDKTLTSTITELLAGKYRAVTDITRSGPNSFLRIEHD